MKPEIAFITGASRGIGRAIAEEFAQAGFSLAINCQNSAPELEQLAAKLKETYHVPCIPLVGDIGREDFVKDAFYMVEEALGSVTVLVNNAGVSHIGLLSDMSLDEWNRIIQTNLTSLFCCCRQAIPSMVRHRSGKIINISSVWGNTGASCEVAYSASKGGINAFTRALAKELGPSNIQVNAIACGVIETDMNKCFDKAEIEILRQEIPADRLGQPQEVAKLVGLLCNGNEYLTGQIITLDGGWT